MTTEERLRLKVIEELTDGKINGTTAAVKLNLSVRQVKRLKKIFKKNGIDGLIHKRRGLVGVRKTDVNLEERIVNIVKEKYSDFGPLNSFQNSVAFESKVPY